MSRCSGHLYHNFVTRKTQDHMKTHRTTTLQHLVDLPERHHAMRMLGKAGNGGGCLLSGRVHASLCKQLCNPRNCGTNVIHATTRRRHALRVLFPVYRSEIYHMPRPRTTTPVQYRSSNFKPHAIHQSPSPLGTPKRRQGVTLSLLYPTGLYCSSHSLVLRLWTGREIRPVICD